MRARPPPSLAEHLGHGLARILAVPATDAAHILPALADAAAHLRATASRLLLLAGRRGQGGEDGGLLPYRLAHALDLPIVHDVVAAQTLPDGGLVATQWRPLGARRDVTVPGSAVLTVHPAAPPPRPFVHAAARRGLIEPTAFAAPPPGPDTDAELRPFRQRPPVTGTAASPPGAGRIVTDATPAEAARLILAHLRALGLLARPSQDIPEPHRGGDHPG